MALAIAALTITLLVGVGIGILIGRAIEMRIQRIVITENVIDAFTEAANKFHCTRMLDVLSGKEKLVYFSDEEASKTEDTTGLL